MVMSFIVYLFVLFCYVTKYLNIKHVLFLNNENNESKSSIFDLYFVCVFCNAMAISKKASGSLIKNELIT